MNEWMYENTTEWMDANVQTYNWRTDKWKREIRKLLMFEWKEFSQVYEWLENIVTKCSMRE